MSVRRQDVSLIPQGVKYVAEEMLRCYYDVAVFASSEMKR